MTNHKTPRARRLGRQRVAAAFVLLGCAASAHSEPRMLPRQPQKFSLEGAVVVAPPACMDAARRLGYKTLPPDAVMDDTSLRWRAEFRNRPLILVGNIVNNRALLPLYAAFLAAADAYYPGGDGFVVRRLVLPQSVLVLAGSTERGALRAIEYFSKHRDCALHVQLGGEAAKRISRSPQRVLPLNAYLFMLRGEKRFAEKAIAQLREQAGGESGYFRASDYRLEPIARAYRILAAHAALTREDMLALDNAWLRTLIANQRQYWRARSGRRIGSRHQTMGTSAFHFIVRMLLSDAAPNDEARRLLEKWDKECRAYFDNALTTFHDDIEGIPSYHSVQPMLHWALEMGRSDYLTKQLPLALERALAVTDSLGAYAGTGTYEEARLGTVKKSIMLGYPLAAYVYLTRDPEWNWILRHFSPSISTWGYYYVWGTHGFATGMTAEREPRERLGLQIVPLGPYRLQRRIKPELRSRRWFEKLSWRSGWKPTSAFMVLQGWQGARADNQPPRDANAILRYTNRGRIWLFSNCRKAGQFYRNAVFVSRGLDTAEPPLGCDLLFRGENDGVIMTATRLADYAGTEWIRYIWWVRGRFVVVIDRVAFVDAGDYVVLCSWRSPQPARLAGRVWEARAGGSVFRLVNVDAGVAMKTEDGPLDGAALPHFLRERRALKARPGDAVWFRNVFAVDEPLAAAACDDHGLVIRGVGAARVRNGKMTWEPWNEKWKTLAFVDAQTPHAAARAAAERQQGRPGVFTLPRERVEGVTVSSDPAPVRGSTENLTDELASAYSGAAWAKGVQPLLTVRLPRRERVWAVEIGIGRVAPRNTLPKRLPPAFETEINGAPARFVPELDLQPLHKGTVYPFVRFVARGLNIETNELRFTAPMNALRRIWVRRARLAPLKVVDMKACDLDGDGSTELIVATGERELAVLDDAGRLRWKRRFPGCITALHADREVLAATREAKLYCFDPKGRLRWVTSFLGVPNLGGDCPTAYSIARWGERIVVGNYARASFLRADGKIEKTTFAYGAFETGWLTDVGDLTGDGARDSLLFNIWATLSIIDGASRRAVGYVSCPRGELKLLCALDGPTSADPRVLVVTDDGAALVRARSRKTVWRYLLAPIACAARFRGATAIAKREGLVMLIGDDGAVRATAPIDGVPCASAAAGDRLFVSTSSRVVVYGPHLHEFETKDRPCVALTAANGRVYGVTPTGRIVRRWRQ